MLLMKTFRFVIWTITGIFGLCSIASAQHTLYSNTFSLSDVTLLEGPFKHARDLNIETLLQYDVDRLLAPYRKEAGLPLKGLSYSNWEGLDGHIAGHYLSALAMNFAAAKHPECKKRLDYIIAELKECQRLNTSSHSDWGAGYAGGVPNSKVIWETVKQGDFGAYHKAWVPWYNLHKMYAGLRDAWLYAGNEDARIMFLKFCDWGIAITSSLTDAQMQSMLDMEHGGMNEIFADAYQLTKDEKYLRAAERFSHNMLLDAMSEDHDNLDNKHANTQVPKAIGFQRIAELTSDDKYGRASGFFWETVTTKRSLAFGGNSRREFFPSVASCSDFISDVEGPESCNSYNMLKLTEGLFRNTSSARYIDYYERTLYNHILATQHPMHGGYVYFTPARPQHYKVYSAPNKAMWCCVGSGMENHSKYNQLIYTHKKDSLFLNLFIASELNWRVKGIKLRQETSFPDEEQTTVTIVEGASKFSLLVRYPSWVGEGELKIFVNDNEFKYDAHPSSYIAVHRQWKKGDKIRIVLPMHNTIEPMPNVPDYVAILHGPVLLAAKTKVENPKDFVADESRWGHIPGGKRLPIDTAPIIIEDNKSKIAQLVPVEGSPMTFRFPELNMINSADAVLQPYFRIHDSRYSMYWMTLSTSGYKVYIDSIAAVEKQKVALEQRTVDFVAPGEQQPEADHHLLSERSKTGNHMDEFWRDADDGGFFSYGFSTGGEDQLSLIVRYWGAEWGNRKFDIFIDEEKLIAEDNTGKWNQSKFIDVEYPIPQSMVRDKATIRVKFEAVPQNTGGAVYFIRLVKRR
jgi:uncharacterized protein